MNFYESYHKLKNLLETKQEKYLFDGLTIYRRHFKSSRTNLLPGSHTYYCEEHNETMIVKHPFVTEIGNLDNQLDISDQEIKENETFDYYLFRPSESEQQTNEAIFLIHGFNEKDWDKYLPWAHYLTKETGKTLILFPIAFHMNRTLSIWSDKRKMFKMSQRRQELFSNVIDSTLTNVAISMRIHARPQRFIWSGLQTYYDILDFISLCRNGEHDLLASDTHFDFMAYSIGCLLAQVLKLTNAFGYFTHSKIALFCGGAVFNRLSPVSRYILDSEANIALYSYMIEHIEKHMEKDCHLNHYLNGPHKEGRIFYSLLDYKVERKNREQLFEQYQQDIMAIALKQDTIIPYYEVINTLEGAERNIKVPVEIMDFPFKYNHVTPFPTTDKDQDLIDQYFRQTFNKFGSFLKN